MKNQIYYKTSDGTTFYKKIDAQNHAVNLKDRNIEKTSKKMSSVSKKEDDEKPMSAKEAISLIENGTLEDIQAFAEDTRKTVKEAYENRIQELTEEEPKEEPVKTQE